MTATQLVLKNIVQVTNGGGNRRGRSSKMARGVGSDTGIGEGAKDIIPPSSNKFRGALRQNVGVFQRLVREGQKFNFGLLGTMFLGMAISRTFGGMLQGTKEAFGIGKIIKGLLLTILAPIMKPLFKIIIGIVKTIMGLPKWAKTLIGSLIVGLAILGTILTVISMIGLGLQSIMFLVGAGGIIAGAALFLMKLGAIVAVVVTIYTLFSSLEGVMKRVAELASVIAVVAGIAGLFTGVGTVPSLGLIGAGAAGLAATTNITINQTNTGGISHAQSNRNSEGITRAVSRGVAMGG